VCVCVRASQLIKTLAPHFEYSNNKGKGKFLLSFRRGSSDADNGVCFSVYIYIKQTRRCYLLHEMKFNKEIVNLCYGTCQTPTSANCRYIMVESSRSNSNRTLWQTVQSGCHNVNEHGYYVGNFGRNWNEKWYILDRFWIAFFCFQSMWNLGHGTHVSDEHKLRFLRAKFWGDNVWTWEWKHNRRENRITRNLIIYSLHKYY
jgi:hypothetical protein